MPDSGLSDEIRVRLLIGTLRWLIQTLPDIQREELRDPISILHANLELAAERLEEVVDGNYA